MALFKKNDNDSRVSDDFIERFFKLMDLCTSLCLGANRAICRDRPHKHQ